MRIDLVSLRVGQKFQLEPHPFQTDMILLDKRLRRIKNSRRFVFDIKFQTEDGVPNNFSGLPSRMLVKLTSLPLRHQREK